jgi:hypothetical protein
MKEVVIYLTPDYTHSQKIYVSGDLTKDQITEQVNKSIGELSWNSFDILN